MDVNQGKLVFPVCLGRFDSGRFYAREKVGRATWEPGAHFYKIKLLMFPNQQFFIQRSDQRLNSFTIYSKMFYANGKTSLQDVVGSGKFVEVAKGYLVVHFPLFRQTVYMGLRPCNL